MRWLSVGSIALAGAFAACGGDAPNTGADAAMDGGSIPSCSELSRSGQPLDLAALGWTNGSADLTFPPRGELVATGDPSMVVGVSATYPRADDFSDGTRYTFFSPWGAWDSAAVIGTVSTTRSIGPSCAGVGRAFETLFNHAFLQRTPAEGPIGEPTETIGPEGRQPMLNASYLARLPTGFLLGVHSESFLPQPPQQPLVVGTFERIIEVDDDGKVIAPADQVVGCRGLSGAPPPARTFDAIALEAGQLIAVQSVGPGSACPPDDQRVTGVPQIRLVLRTPDGTLREGGVLDRPLQQVRHLRLFPRADGAWLVVAADTDGTPGNTASIAYARVDKTGHFLTSLMTLLPRNEATLVDFIGGAPLGDRLVIAAGFAAGLDRRYALYLFDENGMSIQVVDTPRLLGFVRSSEQNRVLVSQVETAADGGQGAIELARYDCAPPD